MKALNSSLLSWKDVRTQAPDHANCETLNLSYNFLEDYDMAEVLDVVKLLPNCKCVDLSGNKILFLSIELNEMLQMTRICSVVIRFNRLASHSEHFKNLQPEVLKKIICIPEELVSTTRWYPLFHKTMHEIVAKSHQEYYKHCK